MKEIGFHSFYLASNHISWAELGLQFPSFRHKVKSNNALGVTNEKAPFFFFWRKINTDLDLDLDSRLD